MSVFDGEIDFRSVTMVDYCKKEIPPINKLKLPVEDNCLIIGFGRSNLKLTDEPTKHPDVLCPHEQEYYKETVKKFAVRYPNLKKMYMENDVDPVPINNEIQDGKRTEYLVKYCSRELPFMSVNLVRRARALQTLRLPDDVEVPATTSLSAYRPPKPEKYAEPPSAMSMRPIYDNSLKMELRRILRNVTGDTSYNVSHGLLAQVILEKNPFGKPRKEPRYGRWKDPSTYIFRIN